VITKTPRRHNIIIKAAKVKGTKKKNKGLELKTIYLNKRCRRRSLRRWILSIKRGLGLS
jgi:hypothetical protein